MACTSCSSKGGCDERKHEQRARFRVLLERLYPDLTWGNIDDAARFQAGVGARESRRLGRALAVVLKAPVYYRPGGDGDLCHFLYVLCLGREPALVDVRDGVGTLDGSEVERVEERYLRVALSTVARLAAVEEVAMTLELDGTLGVIREAPRAGVYDETLLARLRKLTAFLEASDIRYCDFGLLDKSVAAALGDATLDAAPGPYSERFGVAPRLCNFFFYEQPPSTASLTYVELPEAAGT